MPGSGVGVAHQVVAQFNDACALHVYVKGDGCIDALGKGLVVNLLAVGIDLKGAARGDIVLGCARDHIVVNANDGTEIGALAVNVEFHCGRGVGTKTLGVGDAAELDGRAVARCLVTDGLVAFQGAPAVGGTNPGKIRNVDAGRQRDSHAKHPEVVLPIGAQGDRDAVAARRGCCCRHTGLDGGGSAGRNRGDGKSCGGQGQASHCLEREGGTGQGRGAVVLDGHAHAAGLTCINGQAAVDLRHGRKACCCARCEAQHGGSVAGHTG